MRRWRQRYVEKEFMAIGIEGNCSALCGAIERFQHHGRPASQPLSLKEQCARRIALMTNEASRWLLSYHLPAHLFRYVTKDLFDLHRRDFVDQRAREFELCETCQTKGRMKRRAECPCPDMDLAMKEANKFFRKRMNNGDTSRVERFKLVYKTPHDADESLFFIYLSPCIVEAKKPNGLDSDFDDDGYFPQHGCQVIEPVSAEEKLLFVDLMRFFGPFGTRHDEGKFISYFRLEYEN